MMNGLYYIAKSRFSVAGTIDRIVKQVKKEGWHIFAHIDHAKKAREKGLDLLPTELILVGNPEIGPKLMQDQQISAIDLPMKSLVWEDEAGQVNIACNDMKRIRERHRLTDEGSIKKITGVVNNVCSVGIN